jgi:hypothetical protein
MNLASRSDVEVICCAIFNLSSEDYVMACTVRFI